jgi:two-component system OmpR family sensor kinase
MSLRSRLFTTYALIVVLCLCMVAVSVTVLLQGYRDSLAMESLEDMARPVYVQVISLIKGEVTTSELWSNMQEQADKNDIYILFGNRRGDIVNQVTPVTSSGQQPVYVPREELPSRILRHEQGRFVASGGQTFLYSAYPLSRPDQTTVTVDTLIIAVPRDGALAIWTALYRPFLFAGLIALVVSLVISILLARSVYRPIQRVTEAVEKIAEGQYDQELPATGPREVRRLAVNFNQMVEQVKQSQQRLRHFVADVSHQLRSPLTSIQGFAEAMLDGTAQDEATRLKAATIINDESRRMRRQVDELLELARIQSGQLRIAREYVDVNELLEQCQEIMSVQAEEQSILVKTRVEPHLAVYGDIDRLEQVFCNLLDNAIKNSPAKGAVIVNGRRYGTDSIEIHVIDDGPGIPPEQVPFVFDRFYQAGGIRTGVGLGLAIAKEIVVAHGGSIEVSSTPGAGTEFIVILAVGSPGPLEAGIPR